MVYDIVFISIMQGRLTPERPCAERRGLGGQTGPPSWYADVNNKFIGSRNIALYKISPTNHKCDHLVGVGGIP